MRPRAGHQTGVAFLWERRDASRRCAGGRTSMTHGDRVGLMASQRSPVFVDCSYLFCSSYLILSHPLPTRTKKTL